MPIKKLLTGWWDLDDPFSSQLQQMNYQYRFLNRLLLLYMLFSFAIGIYRWNGPTFVVITNLISFILAAVFLGILRRNPQWVRGIGWLMIVAAFVASYAIYLFAVDNSARLVLFYPFIAVVFLLKGRRQAAAWLGVVIGGWLLALALPFKEGGFVLNEVIISSVYLSLMFFILWNFRIVERDYQEAQREMEVQRQLDERLRQSLSNERELFQTILDNAPLGIWMVDPKGKVQFVNRVFCGATGISEQRFLAADSYLDVLPRSASESCMRSDRECMAQNEPHLSSECLTFVDGLEHVLEVTKVRLLNPNGGVRGVIGLAADVTERREHEKQLERIAHYDALTGVPNRVLLADRLRQALARTGRERELMAVCYLDLDGFKPVNDRFGHEEGDRVLVEITRRIKSVIRSDDTVARLGGDEFVVLLLGMKEMVEYEGSLRRLLEEINQPIEIRGKSLQISASIGVTLYPDDMQDADTLLRHADQAMYIAKQAGKNRFHLFDAQHDQRTRTHNALLQQIRYGLEHGEFELYYQPKVEMRTRRLAGAEALIRWNHSTRGLLQPGEFLRAIENTELDILLGEWVIRQALAQMRAWRAQGFNLILSINISAYHLLSPDFVQKLRAEMGEDCLTNCPGCLQIEVLETVAIDDIVHFSELIRACREIGIGFALDDFGTGYSSLTYLNRLEVDTLKIDQSFVRDMLEEKGDQAIVQGIIALAHAFGREVVAEGVETEAHYQALIEMGCEIGQGYGIARPMPASEIVRWSFPGN